MCCLSCGKLIVNQEGKRKYRKDKKFCSQKCYDNFKISKLSKQARKFKDEHGLNKYTIRGIERKLKLIELFGGKCEKCGYDKNIAAFDFHHKDSFEKKFEIKTQYLKYKTEDEILEEAIKCMLLCSNCHRELHNPYMEIKHVKRVLELNKNIPPGGLSES